MMGEETGKLPGPLQIHQKSPSTRARLRDGKKQRLMVLN